MKEFIYNGLEWELDASRNDAGHILLSPYEIGLGDLRGRGYSRHPSPAEEFSLIFDGIERKLEKEMYKVLKYMVSNPFFGEWLSMAFERDGDWLIAYLQPEGLVYEMGNYVKRNFSYIEKRRFNIAGKGSEIGVPLQEFSDEFSLFVFGRKFADFPQAVREKNADVKVTLPRDYVISPVYRPIFLSSGLCIDVVCPISASRGVREIMASPLPPPAKPL